MGTQCRRHRNNSRVRGVTLSKKVRFLNARNELEALYRQGDEGWSGSHRRAPGSEVAALEALYRQGYEGWSARHFHERYVEDHGGRRSYTWVKNRLRAAGLVKRGRRRGRHRLRRPRKPLEGLMVHQDGSTHEWVPGRAWDLIVTSDDATGRVYSGFCVKEEGTWSFGMGVHMSNLPYAAPGHTEGPGRSRPRPGEADRHRRSLGRGPTPSRPARLVVRRRARRAGTRRPIDPTAGLRPAVE